MIAHGTVLLLASRVEQVDQAMKGQGELSHRHKRQIVISIMNHILYIYIIEAVSKSEGGEAVPGLAVGRAVLHVARAHRHRLQSLRHCIYIIHQLYTIITIAKAE